MVRPERAIRGNGRQEREQMATLMPEVTEAELSQYAQRWFGGYPVGCKSRLPFQPLQNGITVMCLFDGTNGCSR